MTNITPSPDELVEQAIAATIKQYAAAFYLDCAGGGDGLIERAADKLAGYAAKSAIEAIGSATHQSAGRNGIAQGQSTQSIGGSMNKPTELLPCPFCGNDGIGAHPDAHGIMFCDNCEAQGPRISFGEPRDASERWNTRALTTDTTGD
jgi:hypothetical protein